MDNFNTPLKKIAETLGIRFPVATFSKDLEHSKSAVSAYYNGKKKPSRNFIELLENKYSITYSDFEESSVRVLTDHEAKLPNGQYLTTMPLVTVEHQSDYPENYTDKDYLKSLPTHSIIIDDHERGEYLGWEVTGYGMDSNDRRAILPGSILCARELSKSDWSKEMGIKSRKYWLIVHKKGVFFKQITEVDASEATITCHSINDSPEFQDFELELKDVLQLHYVVKVTSDPI